jgi:hypothetical protein
MRLDCWRLNSMFIEKITTLVLQKTASMYRSCKTPVPKKMLLCLSRSSGGGGQEKHGLSRYTYQFAVNSCFESCHDAILGKHGYVKAEVGKAFRGENVSHARSLELDMAS